MEVVEQLSQSPNVLLFSDAFGAGVIEIWEFFETGGGKVYEVPLDPFTFEDGELCDIPGRSAWFSRDLETISNKSGLYVDALVKRLCSTNARDLAEGYLALVAFFGPDKFDHFPELVGRIKLKNRFKKYQHQLKKSELSHEQQSR